MKKYPLFVTVLLVTLTLFFSGSYLIVREFNNQTNVVIERQATMADIGAIIIYEKLNSIVDVGVSLASRKLVYESAENGDWDAAISLLDRIPEVFNYVDTVVLLDKEGIFRASIPPMPDSIGKSFEYRDWYKGVSKEWEPYVSEAFKRILAPNYNVISIAIPIKSPDQEALGILLLVIKPAVIGEWVKSIDIGNGGIVSIFDKSGQLIVNDNLEPYANLINYSANDTVKKILNGERGVKIHNNDFISNEEHITAYSPVKKYGYGIDISQPTRTAFVYRDRNIIEASVILVSIIFIINIFTYFISRDRLLFRRQRDRERAVLDNIGDGIVVINRDWEITLWNKSAGVITMWEMNEALGKPLREIIKFIHDGDRKEDISFIDDSITLGRVVYVGEMVLLVKRDGSEIAVRASAAPILGQNGDVDGVVIVFRDATTERESTHIRSEFLYALRKLKTPVTEALLNIEVGLEEHDADKKNEDFHIAQQSLVSVKKLSEHLVSVAEVDQGRITVVMSSVNIVDTLTEIQNRLADEAIKRGVSISIATVSPLIAITTDKKLFAKILLEVIENAVIYSRRGGNVTVKMIQEENEFLFEIADTGVGIPEHEQALIFTKFFRTSNRDSENSGDGLGLYLAKAYVSLVGGKIWFESEEGKGTTFFISLPNR